MLRRLFTAGLLNALLLCGWGGVFAALMCPHASARAARGGAHECCRARLRREAAKPTSAHCHARAETPGDAREAHGVAREGRDGATLQTSSAAHGSEHAAHVSQTPHGGESQTPHGDESQASDGGEGDASRPAQGATAEGAREGLNDGGPFHGAERAAWAVRSSEGCAHCVSKPERPNVPAKARGSNGARREQSRPAQHVQAPTASASFAPAVIPVQGSPPAASRLYVLLNVFLI
jgi:hypothetical protein